MVILGVWLVKGKGTEVKVGLEIPGQEGVGTYGMSRVSSLKLSPHSYPKIVQNAKTEIFEGICWGGVNFTSSKLGMKY